MAYSYVNSKGKKYYLHSKLITRKSGKATTLYFFASRPPGDPTTDAPPPEYKVIETKTGLPVLKKA